MLSRIAAIVSPLLLLACSTSSSPPGPEGKVQATGMFQTVSFAGLTNALADVTTSSKGAALDVVLAQGGRCDDVADGPTKNAVFLDLYLYSQPSGATLFVAPTAPGTFTTDLTMPGPFVEADIKTLDGSCGSGTVSGKMTGTVTVTSLAGGVVVGTFDLTGLGADHATGSFTTIACTGADELSSPSTTTGCH